MALSAYDVKVQHLRGSLEVRNEKVSKLACTCERLITLVRGAIVLSIACYSM